MHVIRILKGHPPLILAKVAEKKNKPMENIMKLLLIGLLLVSCNQGDGSKSSPVATSEENQALAESLKNYRCSSKAWFIKCTSAEATSGILDEIDLYDADCFEKYMKCINPIK